MNKTSYEISDSEAEQSKHNKHGFSTAKQDCLDVHLNAPRYTEDLPLNDSPTMSLADEAESTMRTLSNVAEAFDLSDTGGHETNRTGQREDDAGRF